MCLRRKEKLYSKTLLEAPQDLPCHELLLVTYKRLVVLTDPLQTSSLKRLVLDQLLSMTATGGNMPKRDQESGRRQDPGFQWHARFHAGILYIPTRWWISLDPYKTLLQRTHTGVINQLSNLLQLSFVDSSTKYSVGLPSHQLMFRILSSSFLLYATWLGFFQTLSTLPLSLAWTFLK